MKRELKWKFVPTASVGDIVEPGDVIGIVKETAAVTQKIMVPYGIKGEISSIKGGTYDVTELLPQLRQKMVKRN